MVDSLPKPFKPELLKMTVANALETCDLIVSSQANGTAVPEVVGTESDPALNGEFGWLGLRELLDFLKEDTSRGASAAGAARQEEPGGVEVVLATLVDDSQGPIPGGIRIWHDGIDLVRLQ